MAHDISDSGRPDTVKSVEKSLTPVQLLLMSDRLRFYIDNLIISVGLTPSSGSVP